MPITLTFRHQDDIVLSDDLVAAIQPRLDDAAATISNRELASFLHFMDDGARFDFLQGADDRLSAIAAQIEAALDPNDIVAVVHLKMEIDALVDELLFRADRGEADFDAATRREAVAVMRELLARR